jgi:uncharacterized membrane protein HdeD (DUF308 family)
MMKLNNPRSYSLITGVVLFLFGFLGFAFPNYFSVSGIYLFVALVFGFWGIVVGVTKK